MSRRQMAAWLLALAASIVGGAVALELNVIPRRVAWSKVPAITIISASGDSRVPTVVEAVGFWNRTFEELGTPFRMGAIVQVVGSVPDADLEALSAQTLESKWIRGRPKSFDRFSGDLLIVLSDASFISFTAPLGDRMLVAIKSDRLFPLTLPNVLRNVIAHELGHAVGLGHNSDSSMLMCGRPASCRPQNFESSNARFFMLTDEEKARLLQLYPRDWHADRQANAN